MTSVADSKVHSRQLLYVATFKYEAPTHHTYYTKTSSRPCSPINRTKTTHLQPHTVSLLSHSQSQQQQQQQQQQSYATQSRQHVYNKQQPRRQQCQPRTTILDNTSKVKTQPLIIDITKRTYLNHSRRLAGPDT